MEPISDVSIPESISDANRLQEFVRDASPAQWLGYAEELRDNAELIWSHEDESLRVGVALNAEHSVVGDPLQVSGVSRTYLLLAGFSLENAIKGLLVFDNPSHINTGALSRELKSHDIEALVSKVRNLTLSEDEHEFCALLTSVIPYWGRYPIPLDKNRIMPEVGMTETRRHLFLRLFDRLAHRLYWSVRDGWDSGVGPKDLKMRSARYGDSIDLSETLWE
jgi:hypothetical protein